MPPKQRDKGKDKKKLRAKLLGQVGSSGTGSKASNLGGLESLFVVMLKGMQIRLKENELELVKEDEFATLIYALLEFQSRPLVLNSRINNLLQKEMVDVDKTKMVAKLVSLNKKYDDDKQAWVDEKKALKENKNRLKT